MRQKNWKIFQGACSGPITLLIYNSVKNPYDMDFPENKLKKLRIVERQSVICEQPHTTHHLLPDSIYILLISVNHNNKNYY